jgi:alkylation response protein AidB-like acyl-CoA dehydrogenase
VNTEFSAGQRALRDEFRAYMQALMTDELMHELRLSTEGGGPLWRQAMRQMGADGWIGLGWPVEWGGRGYGPIEQYIFIEEVTRAGMPFPYLTTESIGPAIAEFGSDHLKQTILPGILKGELVVGIGYSEPHAGTDMAALKTRAVREGDEYVISGQKVYTSLAHFADYIFLAVRTGDPETHPRHKGISILLMPSDAEGFSHTPIHTVADGETNTTYYDNVRVPVDNLIGPENGGWGVVVSQLNRERLTLMNPGTANLMYQHTLEHASKTKTPDGGALIDQPRIQRLLASIYVQLRALQLDCRKQAWAIANNTLDVADASAIKVYGYEAFLHCYRSMLEVLGPTGSIKRNSSGALVEGQLELIYRAVPVYGFAGGTNEIQRDLISQFGLGLPRAKR